MTVEFPIHFDKASKNTFLLNQLKSMNSLIAMLTVLVQYAISYYKEGLTESPAMLQAKDEYISEDYNLRVLKHFIDTYCTKNFDKRILHSKLESKFKKTYPDLDLKRGQLGKLVDT